jgi:hypothetical protein
VKSKTAKQRQVGRLGIMLTLDNVLLLPHKLKTPKTKNGVKRNPCRASRKVGKDRKEGEREVWLNSEDLAKLDLNR